MLERTSEGRILAPRGWLVALAAASMAVPAAAYGPRGHQVIGAIADSRLGASAKAAVAKTLGYPLQVAATWADCAKDVKKIGDTFVYQPDPNYAASCEAFATPAGQARMIDYVRRNWDGCADASDTSGATSACHASYHFTDVPIQKKRYDRAFVGTSDHDIVSATNAAIAKLQGRNVPKPFSIKDDAEAILLLAHLVGDLHQPLHVGAIYLDDQGAPVDPGPSVPSRDATMDTRGGNRLEDGASNLHADWDSVAASWDPQHLSRKTIAAAAAVPPTGGSIATWPACWASETIGVSRVAYQGLRFSHDGAAKPGDWVTTFADRTAYLKAKDAMQKEEMVKAGARLAQLLDAIWP